MIFDDIICKINNLPIRTFVEYYDKKKLLLQPVTQRKFHNKLGAELIESVLIKMPIPQLYLFRYTEGEGIDKKEFYEVLDGQQRLATLIGFRKGYKLDKQCKVSNTRFPYKLKTPLLEDIKGKTYDKLGDYYQGIYDDTSISFVEISVKENLSPLLAKRAIFSKINKGTSVLSRAELNNCLFDGKVMNAVRERANELLSDSTFFEIKNQKYEVEDFLLKFLCLISDCYNGDINKDLNNMLRDHKDDDEYVDRIRKIFSCFKKVRELLGDDWMPKKQMKYLYFVIAYFKYLNFHQQILQKKDLLKDKIKNSINEYDVKWSFNSKFSTNSKMAIYGRLEYFCNVLDYFCNENNISLEGKRIFDKQIKEELYATSQTCAICGNKIDNIKDAEVDHIKPWVLGGKTTKDNAQIVHRTCNRHKGASA